MAFRAARLHRLDSLARASALGPVRTGGDGFGVRRGRAALGAVGSGDLGAEADLLRGHPLLISIATFEQTVQVEIRIEVREAEAVAAPMQLIVAELRGRRLFKPLEVLDRERKPHTAVEAQDQDASLL